MEIGCTRRAEAEALADSCGRLGYPATADETASRLRDLLDRADHLVLVADGGDGRRLGWLHAATRRPLARAPQVHVSGLVVALDRRGAGIGRRLLEHAERWAAEAGVRLIRVHGNAVRTRTHDVYRGARYALAATSHLSARRPDTGSP